MRNNMSTKIRKIIKQTVFFRETNRIIYDKNIFLLVLIAPVIYVFFYGSVFVNNTPHHLTVGIIDRDQSSLSMMLKQYCHADPILHIIPYQSVNDAKKDLELQKISAYMYIPNDFEKKIKRGGRSVYGLYVTTFNFMQANEVTKHLLQINGTIGAQIDAKFLLAKNYSKKQALKSGIPVRSDVNSLGNSVYGYGNFVLIGLFILILQQLMLLGISESVARERQDETFWDWYNHAGFNLFRMLTGKITPYLIFFMTYYIFYFTVPLYIFNLHQKANILHLILLAVPFLITISEMALLFGSFFKEKLQALQVLALTSVPFFLVCGYAWPFFNLHPALKILSFLFPTYFMMTAFQSMTQIGASLSDQIFNYSVLFLQSAFYCALVIWRYKTMIKKEESNQ